MNGGGGPAGLFGAAWPALCMFSACPFFFAPCAHILPQPLLLLTKTKSGGAGRPSIWPKNFENFCEVLLNAKFRNSNMLCLEIKHAYAELK